MDNLAKLKTPVRNIDVERYLRCSRVAASGQPASGGGLTPPMASGDPQPADVAENADADDDEVEEAAPAPRDPPWGSGKIEPNNRIFQVITFGGRNLAWSQPGNSSQAAQAMSRLVDVKGAPRPVPGELAERAVREFVREGLRQKGRAIALDCRCFYDSTEKDTRAQTCMCVYVRMQLAICCSINN